MASAISLPISGSPAEMVPTRAISSLPLTCSLPALMASTAAETAFCIPRLMSMGLAPAATFFMPSVTSAWASTVAVVVPSPAASLVRVATSRTSCAPMFSNGSLTSISLAMVTPSLVMTGLPNFLPSTTLRPLGPSVILTVSASVSIPAHSALRASSPCLIIFAIILISFSLLSEWRAAGIRFSCRPERSSALRCYSTMARISLWRTMVHSSPSTFTSVPAYLLMSTFCPT